MEKSRRVSITVASNPSDTDTDADVLAFRSMQVGAQELQEYAHYFCMPLKQTDGTYVISRKLGVNSQSLSQQVGIELVTSDNSRRAAGCSFS